MAGTSDDGSLADAIHFSIASDEQRVRGKRQKSVSVVPTFRKSRKVGQPQFGMVSTIKIKGGPAPHNLRDFKPGARLANSILV
jgi:hypothetical protein